MEKLIKIVFMLLLIVPVYSQEMKTYRGVEINNRFTINQDKDNIKINTKIYFNLNIISNKMTGIYTDYTNKVDTAFIYAIISDRTYDKKKYYTDIQFVINFHDRHDRKNTEGAEIIADNGSKGYSNIDGVDSLIFMGKEYYSLLAKSPHGFDHIFTKNANEQFLLLDNIKPNRINGIDVHTKYRIDIENIKMLSNMVEIYNQLKE